MAEEKRVNYAVLWENIKGTEEAKKVCRQAKTTFEEIEKSCGNEPKKCWKKWVESLQDMLPGIWNLKLEEHESEVYIYLEEQKQVIGSDHIEEVCGFEEVIDQSSILIETTTNERGKPNKINVRSKMLYEALLERGFPVEWKPEVAE